MMKKTLLAATMLFPAWLASPMRADAAPPDGVYVSLGLGADFLQSERAQSVQTRNAPIAVLPRRTSFSTGARVLGSVGYGFGNGLRVELEGTAFAAGRSRVRRGPTTPAVALTTGQADGYEGDAGIFINGLYEFDLSSLNLPVDVQPYLGAGVGYLRAYQRNVPVLARNASFTRIQGDRDALGAQGIVGAAFPIGVVPGLAITAEYRATGRFAGSYDARLQSPNGETRVRLRDDAALSHSLLLGVRYEFGATRPSPSPSVPPVAVAPPVAPARTYLVFFDWDRSDLTERARQVIAEAAQATTRVAVTRIEVAGHADRTGTPAYNIALSRRRADVVAAELARLGVSRESISITAFGDTQPLVATAAGVREPQNRRVEIALR